MTSTVLEPVTHAVVLAGGLGTRIASVLGSQPKALADVAGRPFLDWKLDELQRNGVTHATFLLGHGSSEVIDYLNDKGEILEIGCVVDGPRLLGTGGALANSLKQLPARFFLTYGDNLLEMPYSELSTAAAQAGVPCALAVTTTVGVADTPNAVVSGDLVTSYSKTTTADMKWLDYGVMLLERSKIERLVGAARPPFDLATIVSSLALSGELAAAKTNLRYWEIGTPQTLLETNTTFRSSVLDLFPIGTDEL